MSDTLGMDIETLIQRAGGVGKLAALMHVSHPTVCDWKKSGYVPGPRAIQISRVFDLPFEEVATLIRPPSENGRAV